MPVYSKKGVTPIEKAAILYGLYSGLDKAVGGWTEIYLICEPQHRGNDKVRDYVAKWKRKEGILQFVEEVREKIGVMKAQERQRGFDEGKSAGNSERIERNERAFNSRKIDYNDPEARRNLYNTIIAEAADDPKTQLDAAKIIEQTQRDDKQAARERKTVVFFTPARCHNCELYQKAENKLKKG